MTITKILVANRGEIARRVFATCRRLGIDTVAVYSDADADLPFVHEADVAVRLPGAAPGETYLRGDLVIEAARSTGAEAIHPGYGFLSENAGFARAVLDAGLVWIGPSPAAIEAMGSKIHAKKLMQQAGVPVLEAPAEPTENDLPLLVKASAGGGGRGMRVVRVLADLPDEIAQAEAEAASAFGDGTVFVEPYVEQGRHVEVQVLGDEHGEVVVLGERDCSIQRRHQKVVEESPAPGLSDTTRKALHEAARSAVQAIDYVGAGTVEFLVDATAPERFWFLETNTRLQVEHPVTECIFGVDLVAAQIAVAEGSTAATALGSAAPRPDVHAIEVRLYAEDPAVDYQPQSGTLHTLEFPDVEAEFGALPGGSGIRLDSGFASGNAVGTHYDAMLAKVICCAPTRVAAARRLAHALQRARIHGVTTNRDQLVAILRDEEFLAGRVSTAFLQRDLKTASPDLRVAGAGAALMLAEHDRRHARVQHSIPVAWRNVVSQPQVATFQVADEEIVVEWFGGRDGYQVEGWRVLEASADLVTLERDGVRTQLEGVISSTAGSAREVFVDGPGGSVRLREVPRFLDPADQVALGSLLAPMPGVVISTPVETGRSVQTGDPVVVLEAMKMQHTIRAPGDGVLTELAVSTGQQVGSGDVLAVVTPQDPQDSVDEASAESAQSGEQA